MSAVHNHSLSAMAESTRVKAERKLICIKSPFEDQARL